MAPIPKTDTESRAAIWRTGRPPSFGQLSAAFPRAMTCGEAAEAFSTRC